MARTSVGARDRAHGTSERRASTVEQRGRRASAARAKTRAAGGTPRSGSSLNTIADELDAEYARGERRGVARGKRMGRPAPPSQEQLRRYDAQQRSKYRASVREAQTTRTTSDALPVPTLGGPLDPARGRTLILVFVTLAGLGSLARDTIIGNPNQTTSARTASAGTKPVVKTPQHLRSLAGVFVVGTVALIVNELQPQFGVAMAAVLALDVGVSVFTPARASNGATVQPALFDRIGSALFAGGTPVNAGTSSAAHASSAIPLAAAPNPPKAA